MKEVKEPRGVGPEPVLVVGAEGGSESIVRERTAEGEWRFHRVINQLALCEMFPDETEGIPPFLSTSAEAAFADTLAGMSSGWTRLWPMTVHPEFSAAVLREVERLEGAGQVERWREILAR
jgi:hypothetical protein